MTIKKAFLGLVTVAFFASAAQAGITIILDSGAKTLVASGSLIATPTGDFLGELKYSNPPVGGKFGSSNVGTSMFDSSPSTFDMLLTVDEHVTTDAVIFSFTYFGLAEATITGNGSTLNYAVFSPAIQTSLETLAAANTVLPMTTGAASSGSLLLTVPEPSTYATLAGLGILGFALWRRQAKA